MKLSEVVFINVMVSGALSACGPSLPHTEGGKTLDKPEQTLEQKLDTSSVKLGASREEIEKVLGQPMSVNESDRGLECMYMLGMKGFRMPTQADMGRMQALATAQSLVGMAGGLAGPAGGMIGGIASQVVGMGSSLAAESSMPSMPDPANIRMVMVGYRDGKAISINRMNPNAMGSAPIDQ